jgi:hypothetical protein
MRTALAPSIFLTQLMCAEPMLFPAQFPFAPRVTLAFFFAQFAFAALVVAPFFFAQFAFAALVVAPFFFAQFAFAAFGRGEPLE